MTPTNTTTTTPSLKLLPVTLPDIPILTQIWYAAFSGSDVRRLWPDTPGVRTWWDNTHRNDFLTKPFQKYIKIVDPESLDFQGQERIVAFAKWDLSTQEERGRRFPPWHAETPGPECDVLFEQLEGERARVMGGSKHYYLSTLVTHPDYQRRGAASLLLQWGCDLADEHGVPVYVDASKAGATLYQRFGFVNESKSGDDDVFSMVRRSCS